MSGFDRGPYQYLKMPRSIDITLDENELKFLINLMWPIDPEPRVWQSVQHCRRVLEGRLVKCLGIVPCDD